MANFFKKVVNKSAHIYSLVKKHFYPSPKMIFRVQQWQAENNGKQSLFACAHDTKLSILLVAVSFFFLNREYIDKFQSVKASQPSKLSSQLVYFKTVFYAPHEIKFINMNLMESYNHIDKFIITEGNRTHVGEPKPFVFEQYLHCIPKEFHDKIVYIPVDISQSTVDCSATNDGKLMHKNEDIIWDSFESHVSLRNRDIVISADADEIIYDHIYPLLFRKLTMTSPLLLPLHQFFYRMNYLWKELTIWAPTITYASYYLNRPYPHRWRYEGKCFPFMAGCHFSWQLTLDEMIYKLNTYAHKDIYGHFADKEILRDAVARKKYPFEPNEPFTIEELQPEKDNMYYPKSFYTLEKSFSYLLPPAPIQ